MSDHITLVGNIAGDIEQRSTRGGGTVASFRLAVGERRLDRERNEWVDAHTSFYAVSVFGELGAHALRSFHKGQRVIVNGRLRMREWENENRRGVSADVTAEALGHDLRWGVSQFTRTPRPGADTRAVAAETSAPGSAANAASGTSPQSDSDGWALPGLTEAPTTGEREHTPSVGDGAESVARDAEAVETPF